MKTETAEKKEDAIEYKEYIVEASDQPDLKIKAAWIGWGETSHLKINDNYSNEPGIARTDKLYLTESGKYVCQRCERDYNLGGGAIYTVAICTTKKEVTKFFGYSKTAKSVYKGAKLDCFTVVN